MAAAPITMDKQLSVPRFRERWEAFVKEGQDKSSAQITSWLNDILQTGIAGREQADSKTLIDTLSKLGSDFSWENALLALYVTLYHMPRIPLPIDLDNECSMIASKRPVDRPPVSGAERYVKELISARSPTSYLSLLPRDILRFLDSAVPWIPELVLCPTKLAPSVAVLGDRVFLGQGKCINARLGSTGELVWQSVETFAITSDVKVTSDGSVYNLGTYALYFKPPSRSMEEMHHDLVFSPICVLSNRLLNAQFDRHTRTLRLIAFSGSSRTELTTTTFNQPEWRYHMYVLRSDPSLGDYVLQTCNESDAVLWHLVGNEAKQTILPAVEGSIRSPPCMIDTRIVLVRNDRMLLYRLPDLSSPVGLYPLRNITKQSTLVSFQSSEAVAILWTDKTTLYMSVLRANKAEPDTRSVKLPAACRDPHEVNLVGTMCGLSLILRINIRSVSELWYIDMTTLDVAFKQKEFLAEVYSRVTGMWVAGNSLLCSVEDIATSAVGTLYAFTPDHSDE